jgi:hypothetical protein
MIGYGVDQLLFERSICMAQGVPDETNRHQAGASGGEYRAKR